MEISNELYHHGRLHQKWGVRNGPPYPLDSSATKGYASKQKSKKGIAEKHKLSTAKERHNMSEAELDKRIKRQQKETELKKLEKSNRNDGQIYTEEVLKDIGKRVITTAAVGALLYAGKAIVTKSFDVGDFGDAIFRGGAKKK